MKFEFVENSVFLGGGWIARYNKWEEKGKTKQEAKLNLENAIKWFSENELESKVIVIPNVNRILVLSKYFDGYCIDIVNGKTSDSYGCIGIRRCSSLEALEALQGQYENYIDQ
jgi:hypothetical protein